MNRKKTIKILEKIKKLSKFILIVIGLVILFTLLGKATLRLCLVETNYTGDIYNNILIDFLMIIIGIVTFFILITIGRLIYYLYKLLEDWRVI